MSTACLVLLTPGAEVEIVNAVEVAAERVTSAAVVGVEIEARATTGIAAEVAARVRKNIMEKRRMETRRHQRNRWNRRILVHHLNRNKNQHHRQMGMLHLMAVETMHEL